MRESYLASPILKNKRNLHYDFVNKIPENDNKSIMTVGITVSGTVQKADGKASRSS